MKKSTFMLALLCAALGTATATAMPKDDITAGDGTNAATFSWSDKTLTITGKGDLSKVNVKDESKLLFSAEAAGMIYYFVPGATATEDGTWVKVNQGDSYDSEAKYCEAKVTYSNEMTPSTNWNENYSMTSEFKLTLDENQSIHAIYWGDNGATAYVTVAANNEQGVGNSNNWDNKDSNTGYYFWCIFTGSYSGTEYSLTLKMSDFGTNGVYQGDGYTITLLSESNRDTYGGVKSTIKASVDNLYYSTDATTYTWLPKDKTVEYTDGMKLYLGENTASAEHIRDNASYFAKHRNYLEAATMSFAEYLPYAVEALGCSADHDATVVIKTERGASEIITDNSKLANLNNEITRALVSCEDIETLNLQDTYIKSINAYDPTAWPKYNDPTFLPGTDRSYSPNKNSTLKNLYMPATDMAEFGEYTASNGTKFRVFTYLQGLKHITLSEGIETLGENALSNVSQSDLPKLTSITFPNTLKTAKEYCLNGQSDILTLTFPKGMESIERHAMWGTNPKDVYFLDVNAPKVAAHAWGESNYISNNSMTNEVKVGDTEETSITVNKQTGFAVRQNYETQNGWYAMLHYPAACTKEQAAKYTDITRSYKKIVYGVEDDTFKKEEAGTEGNTQGVMYYYYEPGQETTTLTGKGLDNDANILGSVEAHKRFINIYPTSTNPPYGGNYEGGYEDYYVGGQYIWPSMNQSQRACIVAENNLLWDGVTSIGEGIRNAAKLDGKESTYSATGDGSEYIGLHQFVFTQADVTTDKTDEWDVTKYADGKWHSICLPFNVTKAKMKETFGANEQGEYNFRVCKFHKVDRTDEKLKLYFNDEYFTNAKDEDVVLTAHVSYMIKAKKENMVEGEKVVLKNYVLEAGSPVPTNVTVNAKSSGSEGETEANQYYFIGQYNSGVTIPQYSYFFSKSKGYFRFQAGTSAKWNGYTSVVEAPNGAEDYQKYFNGGDTDAKLSTIWDEDETTGIEKITIVAGDEVVYTNDNVYNLNGQLVSTQGKSGLAKGIYIQNGKKFVVK